MMMRALAILLIWALTALPSVAQTRLLDGFESLSDWRADASTDVSSAISQVGGADGQAMRLTYDFNGRSGYAFAARLIDVAVPENYEIRFKVRGEGLSNTFEIKFTDAGAENVHWRQIRDWTPPSDWTEVVIRRRQITWAWGPDPDRTFRGAERMEFVVVADQGGAGFIEIDDLTIRELPPEPSVPPRPVASATSTDGDFAASRAVDDDVQSAWRSEGQGAQSLTLDLGYEREFGGLTLQWAPNGAASAYRIMASSDRETWREIARVRDGDGGTDWLRAPDSSARWLRLDLERGQAAREGQQMGAGQRLGAGADAAYVLRDVRIEPIAFGETPTTFMLEVAADSRRGTYPRGFHGEQPYWTLVGVDGGGESALIGEDGVVELRRAGPSIEPFVIDNGRVVSWADVDIAQSLKDGDLPIPTVTWTADDWRLEITALADGQPERAQLWTRYRLTNTSPRPVRLTLALAARPFQVNGPRQFLAVPGGVGPIEQMQWNGATLILNDGIRINPLVAPDGVIASTFEAGADPQALFASARVRSASEPLVESDASSLMAGGLTFDVELQPGQTRTFGFMSPLSGGAPDMVPVGSVEAAWDTVEQRVAAEWREKLDRFDLILPPQAQRIEDVMRSSLAHMLMSRQGPVLQPGTRSYNRSWIRDGAMMAEGLNRLGHADLSAAYLDWYTPYLFDNGKVPCCVDRRGADPVPENDSHGEYVFLAAETYRYTGDRELLRRAWPGVQGAIRYMDQLRAETRTPANQTPETRHLYGLLPPSISHEGYSDKPAYSYWDDFWGLLGYREAIYVAEQLGETDAAEAFRRSEAEFAADVMASILATAEHHGIDWIAGAADRGDFDATSTTIALSPGGLQAELPQDLLRNTFDRWWANFEARLSNRAEWADYTPYELRNVGALVRLGRRDQAVAALDFYFSDMRPRPWNGWAEVVGRHLREPRFIGDMPHAWISSDYIRSALDLLVYERAQDQALVLAAGVPEAWLDGEGVGVENVRTPYGALTYRLRRTDGGLELTVEGAAPPGGFVLPWPLESTALSATFDGRPLSPRDGAFTLSTPGRLVVLTR
ncbi:discoidin domain-containing protein [Brevundimonas balnearis]|uniref:Discoidin domain-containing protein n=2 Tax=Brevundimonas balnearis TaxID=1572858 RepID=A0ABV6R0E9_9CAUL